MAEPFTLVPAESDLKLVPVESEERLGKISRALESGGDSSTVSSGSGDPGGRSFGLYQIATKNGTMSDFLDYADKSNPQLAGRLRSAQIGGRLEREWKAISREDPSAIEDIQHNFVKDRHYAPVVSEAAKLGIDPSTRSQALNEFIFSTAIHMGPGLASKALRNALQGVNAASLTDEDIIYRVSAEKGRTGPRGGLTYWSSSPAKTQSQVLSRLVKERDMALGLLAQDVAPAQEQPAPEAPVSTGYTKLAGADNTAVPANVTPISPNTAEAAVEATPPQPQTDVYSATKLAGADAGASIAPQQAVARDIREGTGPSSYQPEGNLGSPDVIREVKPVQQPNLGAERRLGRQVVGLDTGDFQDKAMGTNPDVATPLSRNTQPNVPFYSAEDKAADEAKYGAIKTDPMSKTRLAEDNSLRERASVALSEAMPESVRRKAIRTGAIVDRQTLDFYRDNPRSFVKGMLEASADGFAKASDFYKRTNDNQGIIDTTRFLSELAKKGAKRVSDHEMMDLAGRGLPISPEDTWEQFAAMGPQMAGQVGLGLLSGGATLPMAAMGVQIAGGSYRKMEDKADPLRNMTAALANTALQAPLEYLGLSKTLAIFKASGYGAVAQAVGKDMATQWFQEWMQSYPDVATEIYAEGGRKGWDAKRMAQEFSDRFYETTRQGINEGAIAAMWGPVVGVGKINYDLQGVAYENMKAKWDKKLEAYARATETAQRTLGQREDMEAQMSQAESGAPADVPASAQNRSAVLGEAQLPARDTSRTPENVAPPEPGRTTVPEAKPQTIAGNTEFQLIPIEEAPVETPAAPSVSETPGSETQTPLPSTGEPQTIVDNAASIADKATKEYSYWNPTTGPEKLSEVHRVEYEKNLSSLLADGSITKEEYGLAMSEYPGRQNPYAPGRIAPAGSANAAPEATAKQETGQTVEGDNVPPTAATVSEEAVTPQGGKTVTLTTEAKDAVKTVVDKALSRAAKATSEYVHEHPAATPQTLDDVHKAEYERSLMADHRGGDLSKADYEAALLEYPGGTTNESTRKAEAARQKKGSWKVSNRDVAQMTAGEIRKEQDKLEAQSDRVQDNITGKYGEMPYSEFVKSDHPMAAEYDAITKRQAALNGEITRRKEYGGTDKRTPRGAQASYEQDIPEPDRSGPQNPVSEKPENPLVQPGDPNAPSQFSSPELGPFTHPLREAPLHWVVEQIEKFTGKTPLVKKLNRLLNGYFVTKKGEIVVNSLLGKNPAQVRRTAAHEFGHLLDMIPDKDLKGTILGKLSGLKAYKGEFIARGPWMPGPLTTAEVDAMRREIEQAQSGTKETWIDEMVKKVTGGTVTPKDILDIWNSMDTSHLPPNLVNYIKGLGRAEKKAIVLAAMKGMVPEDIAALGLGSKVEMVPTGNKVKQFTYVTPDPAVVKAELQRRIVAETAQRRLIDKAHIEKELKELSRLWRPWDRKAATPGFIKYRDNPKELYADAMSALMNNPEWAKSVAPTFYEGFFNYLDSKPEFAKGYAELQEMMLMGEEAADYINKSTKSFESGDVAMMRLQEALAKESNASMNINAFMAAWNRWHPIQKLLNKKGGDSSISATMNPMTAIDDMLYAGTLQYSYMAAMSNKVLEPLHDENIPQDIFGVYLKAKSTLGIRAKTITREDQTTARKALERIEKQYPEIKRLYKAYQDVRVEKIIQPMIDQGFLPDKFVDRAANNLDYARFGYEKFLAERGTEHRHPGSMAKGLRGSFESTMNPLKLTLDNDVALIAASLRSEAIAKVTDYLGLAGMARPARMKHGKNGSYFVAPDVGSGKALLHNIRGGKRVAHEVPAAFAKMFDPESESNTGYRWIAKVNRISKGLYVHWNARFIMRNISRDLFSSLEHLPTPGDFAPLALERELAVGYALAIADSVKRGGRDALIMAKPILKVLEKKFPGLQKMVDTYLESGPTVENSYDWLASRGALIAPGNYMDWFGESTGANSSVEDMFIRYGIHDAKNKWYMKNPVTRGSLSFIKGLQAAAQQTEYIGKMAAYHYMRRLNESGRAKMSEREIVHNVRNYAGSPNFLRQPTQRRILNTILLFSGPWRTGWMQEYGAFKRDKTSYAWRKFKYAVVPAVFQAAVESGKIGAAAALVVKSYAYFDGDDEKKRKIAFEWQQAKQGAENISISHIMRGVSYRDKMANWIIPIGFTEEGHKSVFLRIPKSEASRIPAGIAYTMARLAMRGDVSLSDAMASAAGSFAGDLPSVIPMWSLGGDVWDYAIKKQAPTNSFTGRPMVPQAAIDDRDPRAHGMFLNALAMKYGGMLGEAVVMFRGPSNRQVIDEVEQTLKMSGMGLTFKPFIGISDEGHREDLKAALEALSGPRHIMERTGKEGILSLIAGEKIGPEDYAATMAYANTQAGQSYMKKLAEERIAGPLGAGLAGNEDEDFEIIARFLQNPVLRDYAENTMALRIAKEGD